MILENPKYPILEVFLIIIPKIRVFLKNLALSIFPFRSFQLYVEFQKNPEAFCWKSVYLMTYWNNDLLAY